MNVSIFYLSFLLILIQLVSAGPEGGPSQTTGGKSEPQLENTESQLANLHKVTSDEDFDKKLEAARHNKQLVVIDFYATWCAPCSAIEPFFAKYVKKFPNVIFLKVDVDKQKNIKQRYNVIMLPTFKFIKKGKEKTVTGADEDSFEETFEHFNRNTYTLKNFWKFLIPTRPH